MNNLKTVPHGQNATQTKYLMNTVTSTPQPQNAKSLMSEEEYHSIKETYKFLCYLIDPQRSVRLPKKYREMAKKCLKHYPHSRDWGKLSDTFDFFNPR